MSNPVLEEYDGMLTEIKETIDKFVDAAVIGREGRGSKTKALEARKLSQKLTKDLKDFRALSIKNDKEK